MAPERGEGDDATAKARKNYTCTTSSLGPGKPGNKMCSVPALYQQQAKTADNLRYAVIMGIKPHRPPLRCLGSNCHVSCSHLLPRGKPLRLPMQPHTVRHPPVVRRRQAMRPGPQPPSAATACPHATATADRTPKIVPPRRHVRCDRSLTIFFFFLLLRLRFSFEALPLVAHRPSAGITHRFEGRRPEGERLLHGGVRSGRRQ